jgi:hypothetical protein
MAKLEIIRIRKAKALVIQGKYKEAERQLRLLKETHYKKYKRLNIEKQINDWKITLNLSISSEMN